MAIEYTIQKAAETAGVHQERIRQLLKGMRKDWHYRLIGKAKIINARGMKEILERPNQRIRRTR